jgi:hypothetical protein
MLKGLIALAAASIALVLAGSVFVRTRSANGVADLTHSDVLTSSGTNAYRLVIGNGVTDGVSVGFDNSLLAEGTNDNDQVIEEPDELKGSSLVLKPSGGSDPVA